MYFLIHKTTVYYKIKQMNEQHEAIGNQINLEDRKWKCVIRN